MRLEAGAITGLGAARFSGEFSKPELPVAAFFQSSAAIAATSMDHYPSPFIPRGTLAETPPTSPSN